MRVVVASTIVPLLRGGGRMIVDDLVTELRARDHDVETLLLPVSNHAEHFVDDLIATRLLDLRDAGDRLIAIRAPAHLIRHPNKVVWFLHHQRQAYDLWGTPWQGIPDNLEGELMRRAILAADEVALAEAKAIFSISRTVAKRLVDFSGLDSTVLYPALWHGGDFPNGDFGNYVVAPSRITTIKRQDLLLESMRHVKSDARLVLIGTPDDWGALGRFQELVEEPAIRDRVTFTGEWMPEDEKRALIAGALACAYVPYDEDGIGYPVLEGFQAGKPVITCTDSGGPTEIVEDDRNGFVTPPDPIAIARVIDQLRLDQELTRRLGQGARDQLDRLGINWDHIIERLLA